MADLDLCYMPAHEALRRFRDKSLSPVELMGAVIARAEAVKDPVGAFTYTHFDEAMELARKAEAKYARGGRVRALEGLPIGIKDENEIAGKPTSSGSLILKDHVADRTSVNNQRILAAGGIVHARTATPEFSAAGVCWSRLWGVTRNPWNPKFTPGGSSGGSAASLAAGTSPLAMGSDIGGSIRIPASACGVVGYKPPYGRNTDDPPFNLDFFCHTGPMARTVRDAALLQNVVTGPHASDIASLRPKLTIPLDAKPISGWKIAWSMDLGIYEVDPEVRAHTEAALDVFRSLGATVTEVKTGWGPEVFEACMAYLTHIFGGYISGLLDDHAGEMTSYVRAFAEKGKRSTARDYVAALEVIAAAYAPIGTILERHDLLICPTLALPAPPAEFDSTRDSLQINGKPVNPDLGWAMTVPFNMLSRLPVLAVPSGRAANGVPTGIQIVGRSYCDRDVFRAGMAYEAALGGWYGTDQRPSL
ncbi:MAG: amidase [Pseudorhodobacter sp.]|nr:MAG: amidase [Pseudorhodobacter sp.]